MAATNDRIPVTVLSGYLGAGKTTLVNNLLADPGDHRIAVIVNDMGEINIDAELLASEAADRANSDADGDGGAGGEDGGGGDGSGSEGIVDLTNGCICCRLQDDLLTEAKRLVDSREFDYLVVEASGISEPIPIARAFTVGTAESDIDPSHLFDLDTMVTVLDTYGFWKEFDSGTSIPDEPDPTRPLADVLIDGIEFCDVLLMNKCDMVPDDALDEIETVVHRLGPRAEVIRTSYSEVDPEEIVDTGRFDFEEATRSPGWKRELGGGGGGDDATTDEIESGHSDGDRETDHAGHDHTHDHDGRSAAEAHGVTSFVYRESRPFHPERFDAWLAEWSGDVIRAKGFFHVASREDQVMGLSRAGRSVQAGPIGEWSGEDPETKLVFIGTDMGEEEMVADLDDCLATDAERASESLPDPFPA